MLKSINELIRHKWWANSNLLHAIAEHKPAAEDSALRKVLHHILIANRYWLLLTLGQTFREQDEVQIPESHESMIESYSATEELEIEWLSAVKESDLERRIQPPALPDLSVTVAEAILQVSLHSQGHRSQCASRLRALGGTPLPTDFVLWVRDQPKS